MLRNTTLITATTMISPTAYSGAKSLRAGSATIHAVTTTNATWTTWTSRPGSRMRSDAAGIARHAAAASRRHDQGSSPSG